MIIHGKIHRENIVKLLLDIERPEKSQLNASNPQPLVVWVRKDAEDFQPSDYTAATIENGIRSCDLILVGIPSDEPEIVCFETYKHFGDRNYEDSNNIAVDLISGRFSIEDRLKLMQMALETFYFDLTEKEAIALISSLHQKSIVTPASENFLLKAPQSGFDGYSRPWESNIQDSHSTITPDARTLKPKSSPLRSNE